MSSRLFCSLRGLSAGDISRDLAAGLTLAAIAIPEQMATARLGGFDTQLGLLAFLAGSVAFAAFGASRLVSVGADSTITSIFAGALAALAAGRGADQAALAGALALLVGGLLIVGGVLRLGWIADLLSQPVLAGFLAGISIHIVLSQLPALLGIPGGGDSVYRRLAVLASHLDATNPLTLALGFGVFAGTLLCEKFNPRIPGALIALAAATAAVFAFGLQQHGVAVLGDVGSALPRFALPSLDLRGVYELLPLSTIIALVVMVQTAATTRSFPSTQAESDVGRDFIGVGGGNMLAGLIGAFPVNASPPRTALMAEVGARSQAAGLLAVVIALALATLGTGLIGRVPEAALAGVLLFIAQRIFRLQTFMDIYRRTRGEFVAALVTVAAMVLLPIEIGVAVGIFLSLAHGVFIITRARPIELVRVPGTTVWWPPGTVAGERQKGTLVIAFQAPLSFLNAYDFQHAILDAIARKQETRLVVLEASNIVAIDYTASDLLAKVIRSCRARGIDFAVARLESVRAQEAFASFGLAALLGPDHMFRSVEEAIRSRGIRDQKSEIRRNGSDSDP
jgi:SulP family sulfate permease